MKVKLAVMDMPQILEQGLICMITFEKFTMVSNTVMDAIVMNEFGMIL